MVKRTNASADFYEYTVDLFVKDVLAAHDQVWAPIVAVKSDGCRDCCGDKC